VFATQSGLTQQIPHRATLTPSKDKILSTEVFTVTYELTDVEGYLYVGVREDEFEALGKKRWEGRVNSGERITVRFQLKLRQTLESISEKIPIVAMFSYRPHGEQVVEGVPTTTYVKISDYSTMRDEIRRSRKGFPSGTGSETTIDVYPIEQNSIRPAGIFTIDSTTRRLDSPPRTLSPLR
jgi:hypothetical protein